jgi:hypothetical protein
MEAIATTADITGPVNIGRYLVDRYVDPDPVKEQSNLFTRNDAVLNLIKVDPHLDSRLITNQMYDCVFTLLLRWLADSSDPIYAFVLLDLVGPSNSVANAYCTNLLSHQPLPVLTIRSPMMDTTHPIIVLVSTLTPYRNIGMMMQVKVAPTSHAMLIQNV